MAGSFRLFLSVWVLAWAGIGLANNGWTQDLHFDRFDSRNGLSSNTVLSILQDREGFLWVGTVAGLNRYDGYTFTTYRHDPADSTSLPHNYVNVLREDAAGRLWIGTGGGLATYDPAKERFVRHALPLDTLADAKGIAALATEPSGALWVLAHASPPRLYRYDPEERTATESGLAMNAPVMPLKNPDRGLLTGDSGSFQGAWLQRGGSLILAAYDAARGTFDQVKLPGVYLWEGIPFYPAALAASSGWTWVRSPPAGAERPLPAQLRYLLLPADRVMPRRALLEDRQGVLWMGTDRGLYRYDPSTQALSHHDVDLSATAWLSNNVQSLYEDAAGALWVGTLSGLYRYDPHRKPFTHLGQGEGLPADRGSHTVMVVLEDRDGVLWAGTFGGGLLRIDRKSGAVRQYRHRPGDPHSLCHDQIWALHEDRDGTLWVGSDVLCAFDRRTERFTRYEISGVTIAEDAAGMLWTGGGRRLYRFDPRMRKVIRRLPFVFDGGGGAIDAGEGGSLLWIGTSDGKLIRYDLATQQAVVLADSLEERIGRDVMAVREAAGGGVWMGNRRGLFHLDSGTGRIEHVLGARDLPNPVVYSILGDARGRLWLGTGQGLVRYDPQTGILRSYDAADGTGNTEYNRRAAFRSPDGTMYFGGLDGITRFHPDAIMDNPYVPPVTVTAIRKVGRDGPATLKVGAIRREGLVLDPGDHTVAFEFAALNFTQPEKNRYRYRLEGYEEAWVEAGTSRAARYTNLPPGRYTFRVQGSNNDGLWNEQGAALRLTVLPAWWQTWWFRLLTGMAVLGLFYAAYRYRVSQLLRLERLRLRIATDLHDDIGSKLSSIALVSDMVRDNPSLDPSERRHLNEVSGLARHMVDDLREIVWMINPSYDRLDNLVAKMRYLADAMLNGTAHTFEAPEGGLAGVLGMEQRRHVYLAYKEMLHNVVRHAAASHVAIRLARHDGMLVLEVRDDGGGFDPEQTDEGTGMASLRERAQQMEGTVEVESAPGRGTAVRVTARITEFRDGTHRRASYPVP